MKKLIKTISTVFFALAMVLSSCEKDPSGKEPGGAKAAKINIEIQKYYNELGTMSLKNWEAGDKVAAFNADNADPVLGYGSPITTGAQTSLFTIAVTSVANGDDIMAYYPSSADVTPVSGGLKAKIASLQNGTLPSSVFVGNTKFNDSYSGSRMTLKPFWCVLYANVQMGAYSIKKAEIVANAGEKIAGDIDIKAEDLSVTASASSVTVEYAEARDCRLGGITIPIAVAPVALSKGYTITFTTENGETFQYKNEDAVTFELGGKHETATADSDATQLLVCGDNMIYLLDAELALSAGYKNAVLWEWDAKKYAEKLGKRESDMIRLDDCKPVDDNTKILATSSKSYAVLIDKATGDVLWYSVGSGNAHSAEFLPNNRIAVACSEGGDVLQIFDIGSPNQVKFSTPLPHGHGVVWNPVSKRLYAIGSNTFNIYKLTDWATAAPKLTLEKSIATNTWVTGLHDMLLVDENTLMLAGNRAAFYNITTGVFTSIPIFASSNALKSVNINGDTGECWFTDPSKIEIPELTWASHTIRYTDDVNKTYETKNFKIDDLNIYKVRVFKW